MIIVRCLMVVAFVLACVSSKQVQTGLAATPAEENTPCINPASIQTFIVFENHLPVPDDCLKQDSGFPKGISELILPDLLTLPPFDLKIVTLTDGSRELRLSNTIWNSGAGPLELEGSLNPITHKTRVEQHIQMQTGPQFSRMVGEFIFHESHDHWHFERFSVYELWKLTPTGRLDKLVSHSTKISYCVIDTDVIDPDRKDFSPIKRYQHCGQNLQGLSVGWGDTYMSHLDGQSIHLATAGDGFYALKSTANPDAILLESNYQNNTALIFLEISGESLKLVDLAEIIERRCMENNLGYPPELICKY